MKYLKLFQTESEYTAYKESEDFVLPNVSYTNDAGIVYYNPLIIEHKSLLKCTFNATEENKLAIANTSNIKSFKVDGNIIPTDRKLTYINNSEIQVNYFPEEDVTTINCPDEYFMTPNDLKYVKFMIPAEDDTTRSDPWDKIGDSSAFIFIKDDSEKEGVLFEICDAKDILISNHDNEVLFGIDMVCFNENFSNIPEGSLPPNSKICVLFDLNEEFINCLRYYYGPTDQLPLIDGYFFEEIGEHSIEMELLDNNIITTRYDHGPIGSTMFYAYYTYTNDRSSCVTSIELPDNIQTIGGLAFGTCANLKTVIIPDSVTTIGARAFFGCSNLSEITCLAPTAPNIGWQPFQNVKESGTLYVPVGSDYSSWMNYLNEYNWTSQEI